MSEKISTLVLKVNLDCHYCKKKIRKVLCKLQEPENIKSTSYDEKNGTITISGPFDPKHLCGKLKCKACKVIKSIEIKEEKKPPKITKTENPNPNGEQKQQSQTDNGKNKVHPIENPGAERITVAPSGVAPYIWQPPPGPVCCHRPCYAGHHGGCRCCSCGRVYVLDPRWTYGGPYHQFRSVEDSSASCWVM